MQSALLVSKEFEGVARAYNQILKRTDYFKVYNAVDYDERLILGPAQHMDTKIVYVLHPIVA